MAETCYQMNDTLVLTSAASWDVEGVIHATGDDAEFVSLAVEAGHTPGDYAFGAVVIISGEEFPFELYHNGSWGSIPSATEICVTGGADANNPDFLAFMQENSSGGGGGDEEGINVCADPRYAMIVPIPDGSLVAGDDTTFGQAYSAFQNGEGVFLTYEGDNGTVTCPVTGITEEEGTYTITYIDGGMNVTMTVSGSESETITITTPQAYKITCVGSVTPVAYRSESTSSEELTSAYPGITVYIWIQENTEVRSSQVTLEPLVEKSDGWWTSFVMPAEDVTVFGGK